MATSTARGVDDGADSLGLDSIGKDSHHSENRPTPPKEEKSVESSPCMDRCMPMLTVASTYSLNIYDCDAHEIIAFYSQLIQTRSTDSVEIMPDGTERGATNNSGEDLAFVIYDITSRVRGVPFLNLEPAGLPRSPRRQHRLEPREAINTKKGSRLISGWTSVPFEYRK